MKLYKMSIKQITKATDLQKGSFIQLSRDRNNKSKDGKELIFPAVWIPFFGSNEATDRIGPKGYWEISFTDLIFFNLMALLADRNPGFKKVIYSFVKHCITNFCSSKDNPFFESFNNNESFLIKIRTYSAQVAKITKPNGKKVNSHQIHFCTLTHKDSIKHVVFFATNGAYYSSNRVPHLNDLIENKSYVETILDLNKIHAFVKSNFEHMDET